jgi:hypothetical protein
MPANDPRFDKSNQSHVSALAARLGRGPLAWQHVSDSKGWAQMLVCRLNDGSEICGPARGPHHPNYSVEDRTRSLRLLACAVFDHLLAEVAREAPIDGFYR